MLAVLFAPPLAQKFGVTLGSELAAGLPQTCVEPAGDACDGALHRLLADLRKLPR